MIECKEQTSAIIAKSTSNKGREGRSDVPDSWNRGAEYTQVDAGDSNPPKAVNLRKSQLETIAMAGYQSALNDLYSLGVLDRNPSGRADVMAAQEASIEFVATTSFNRYLNL